MFRNILYKSFGIIGSHKANRFQKSCFNCAQSQSNRLNSILEENTSSIYGKKHGFASIKSLSDFKKAVPLNTYEDFLPYIQSSMEGENSVLTTENPYMFATTSGTTGNRKFIPVTRSYMKEFREASVVSGYNLYKNYPELTKGVVLSIFSTATESFTKSGIPCGAISGRLYLDEPELIKKYISPIPYDVFLIEDYEARYYSILRCALVLPVSCIYTLNPSTIILLAKILEAKAKNLIDDIAKGDISVKEKLLQKTKNSILPFLKPDKERALFLYKLLEQEQFTPDKIWPQLAVISCWTKAAASFYLQDFPKYFGNTPIADISYGASEGRGTVYIDSQTQCLAIRSHFYEFIEESEIEKDNPQTLAAWELEKDKNYNVLFTTSGGLYRYNMNDVVRVVGWNHGTPIIDFLHKGGNICSFTGEKITESQVTQAVLSSTKLLNLKADFFTVIPEFRPQPHYQVWVEIDHYPTNDTVDLLARNIDKNLGRHNCEYQAKRDSLRLGELTVNLLKPGTYRELRQSLANSGTPDAQIKISHLNPKEEIKKKLLGKLFIQVS